jgi:hypothetical protein
VNIRWPWYARWLALLAGCAVLFLGLRLVASQQRRPVQFPMPGQVMVVGVTGHYALTAADRAVLQDHAATAQVGAVSVRPRYIGDCAAAGWATLGAGRRTSVAGLCNPQVQDGRVTDWPQRLAAAAGRSGDAQLGTLAASVPGCIMAVGNGAALAAALPDGSLARYETLPQFLASGGSSPCPVTLVDAGNDSDSVITELAGQAGVTVILTGIGPPAASDNPGLQVIYRLGSGPPGWLTSASTRRAGVVNLADLTRTLIDSARQDGAPAAPLDGAPIQVFPTSVTVADEEDHLRALAALSYAVLVGDAALGIGGAALLVIMIIGLVRRRLTAPRLILGLGTVLPAAMMLTGAAPWNEADNPGIALTMIVFAWAAVLTAAAFELAKVFKVPVAVAGAAITMAAFTIESALGGVMEPGSMLNSRPVNGGRWYGFGNVSFPVYAAAALILAGYVAHRLRLAGHRLAAVVAAAVIGFTVVLCDGWPSMGADFGGVIALTPGLIWLLLTLYGIRLNWGRLLAISAGTVALIVAISWLDWLRGPTSRSHLGSFFQRVLDGDATDVIIRKAVSAAQSMISPLGIVSILGGILLWVLIFTRALPALSPTFTTIRPTAIAALATAIIGTLLNDGGISVWLTLTASFTLAIGSLLLDLRGGRLPGSVGPEHMRQAAPT